MARKFPGYGWNPDMPDGRDLMYAAPPEVVTQLPPTVGLRGQCPDVLSSDFWTIRSVS